MIVIRERSGSSVGLTASESMLNPRRVKRPATRERTPGRFSTSTESVCFTVGQHTGPTAASPRQERGRVLPSCRHGRSPAGGRGRPPGPGDAGRALGLRGLRGPRRRRRGRRVRRAASRAAGPRAARSCSCRTSTGWRSAGACCEAGDGVPIMMLTARDRTRGPLGDSRSGPTRTSSSRSTPLSSSPGCARCSAGPARPRSAPSGASATWSSISRRARSTAATAWWSSPSGSSTCSRSSSTTRAGSSAAERLLTEAWGYRSAVETNAVDVYVGYLRRKLEEGGEERLSGPSAAPASSCARRGREWSRSPVRAGRARPRRGDRPVIPSTRSVLGARARRQAERPSEPPPPERRGVRGRLRGRSPDPPVSTRLALIAAAGISVVLGGFALGAYLLIADRARERLDDSLVQTAASSRGPRAAASSG